MKAVRFRVTRHQFHLANLYASWQAPGPATPSEIPKIGYIVFDNQVPVAAAFLRKVEGGYAQLDGLVSNKHAAPGTRTQALDEAISQCLNKAKCLKIKAILATTADNNTLARALRHGFTPIPTMTVVVIDPNRSL